MEKVMAKILERILAQMSDQFRAQLITMIKNLEKAAEQTENPWDDILVLVLKCAVGIE